MGSFVDRFFLDSEIALTREAAGRELGQRAGAELADGLLEDPTGGALVGAVCALLARMRPEWIADVVRCNRVRLADSLMCTGEDADLLTEIDIARQQYAIEVREAVAGRPERLFSRGQGGRC